MKQISIFFILSILGITHFSYAGNASDREIDSIYSTFSQKDKFQQLIWIRTDNPVTAQEKVVMGRFGGIYHHAHQLSGDQLDEDIIHALELDPELHRLGFDEQMPGLYSLHAIRDEVLIRSYLTHIRNTAVTYGYDYLILPVLTDSNNFLATTLAMIHAFDPDYFILPATLGFNPPVRRKLFFENVEARKAIVIDEELLPTYDQALKRPPRRIDDYRPVILDQLRQVHTDQRIREVDVRHIVHQIWTKSVIPLQQEKVLPVRGDSIAVWITDEESPLKKDLDLYYRTVLNVKYDNVPAGVPVVIDGRYNVVLATQYAGAFHGKNPVIWIGGLGSISNIDVTAALLIPENHSHHDFILSQMIYGSEGVEGMAKFPIPFQLNKYDDQPIRSQLLLGYTQPEWTGMDPAVIDSIDVLAEEMIRNYATPGAQVIVIKDGKIVVDKAYGFLTYDSLIQTGPNTIYDLASLTKVMATLPAMMKLLEEGKIHLDSTVSHYLPDYEHSNKGHVTLRQLLTHQAGLLPYIPFWKRSLRGDMIEVFYYRSEEDEQEDRRSYGFHPDPVMKDSLESWIKGSRIYREDDPPYIYSDLGFMVLHQVVENVTGTTLEEYVQHHFYRPLHLDFTQFNPLTRGFEIYQIAPTEYDYYFREEQVWGVVHDRNAAIFGGVAGHAGLFSNAKNLAILVQMLLQGGRYGGKTYLSSETISMFNQPQFKGNRRGLGWDKPGVFNPNISPHSGGESFGHTGFTGTMIWADPKHNLAFIFLSNRIFPDANNKNLMTLDTRRRIHDTLYRSIHAHEEGM